MYHAGVMEVEVPCVMHRKGPSRVLERVSIKSEVPCVRHHFRQVSNRRGSPRLHILSNTYLIPNVGLICGLVRFIFRATHSMNNFTKYSLLLKIYYMAIKGCREWCVIKIKSSVLVLICPFARGYNLGGARKVRVRHRGC